MAITILNSLLNANHESSVLKILSAGLQAADPQIAVRACLRLTGNTLHINGLNLDFEIPQRVHLISAGKASIPMARGVVDVLGNRVTDGVLITKNISDSLGINLPPNIEVLKGNHPIPGEQSLESTRTLVNFCQDLTEDDLVICLISGGGSALMTMPYEGIDQADMQALTRELLKCGASIDEINILRKHLDQVKGGGLAGSCYPATVLTLAISDVVGSPPAVIASGPTVPDGSTFNDAIRVIQKYKLQETIPGSIPATLQAGQAGRIPETLKSGDLTFEKCFYQLIASNEISVSASLHTASRLGFETNSLGSEIQGEAREAGKSLVAKLTAPEQVKSLASKPLCYIGGGETTVRIHGNGLGGRNLELALAAVKSLDGLADVCLVTLATDGEDGPTGAAGAVVTGETYQKGLSIGCDPDRYLDENDSYHYFELVGGLIHTGSTGTNVMDLVFLFRF